MLEPTITDFDNAYLENAGKAPNNRNTYQPQRVTCTYSDWSKFAEYEIKKMGAASSDKDYKYVLELIDVRIWSIFLTL